MFKLNVERTETLCIGTFVSKAAHIIDRIYFLYTYARLGLGLAVFRSVVQIVRGNDNQSTRSRLGKIKAEFRSEKNLDYSPSSDWFRCVKFKEVF